TLARGAPPQTPARAGAPPRRYVQMPGRSLDGSQQTQLTGPPRRVGPGAAIELQQDAADVRFHRTRAQEQLTGNLPAGMAHGNQPDDLDFPPGEIAVGGLRQRATTEAPFGSFAQLPKVGIHAFHQWPSTQSPERAVSRDQMLDSFPAPI